jgi:TonB family protein
VPAPSSQRQRWLTLGVTLGVSALAHLLVWPISEMVIGGRSKNNSMPAAGGAMEVSLLDPDEDPNDPDERIERKLETGESKLVQLDRVPDERPPEEETQHVSEFDSRVAHETRAPNQRPQPGSASMSGDRPEGRRGQSDRSSPSDSNARAQALALLPGTHDGSADSDATDENPLGRTSELPAMGGKPATLSPSGSPGTREALMKSLGEPGSFDDLDDKIDEGDENIVNSKRWKYASFFNRVRSSVASHWHPEVVHAARDPDGSIFGTRTRKTKLIIKLNSDGSLHGIELEAESGVDYLDEEAIRAVRSAAPFANPPPGLVDRKTGRIEFGFAFIFEIHGGTRIFRYRR